jgi:FkbM family methyltransferase
MKRLTLDFFRWYFSKFPIRKGKMPILNLITRLGLTRSTQFIGSFDNGILIHIDLEDWIQKQIFFFGRYEVEKLQTLYWQKNLKENMVIMDIGANIGYYSLMAARRIKSGIIYAFEPVDNTFKKLEENIRLNDFRNIKTFKMAVSDNDEPLQLFVGSKKNTGTSSITTHYDFDGKMETVQSATLQAFVVEHKISHIDFVKIDVEGAEMKVLQGAKKVLQQLNPVVLIELLDSRLKPAGSSVGAVYSFFKDMNYVPYNIDHKLNLVEIREPVEGSLIIFKKTDK